MNDASARLRVLLISPVEGGGQAGRWLRSADLDGHVVRWDHDADAETFDVVWVDSPSLALAADLPRALRSHGNAGDQPAEQHSHANVGLLLTRGACRLVEPLGLGPQPGEQTDTVWRDAEDDLHLFRSFTEFPHIRGHSPMRRHPLFDGLGNGTYTWWPAEEEPFVRLAWRWPDWPPHADVIAVERSYIHVNADRATIWSHPRAGAPPVLCIGAYLPFESRDFTFRKRLERLARNALQLAAGRAFESSPGLLWRRSPPAIVEDPALPSTQPAVADGPLPAFDGPALDGTPAEDSPFTLAGRRVLIVGGEARGIDEIWIHPLRVLSALRIADSGTTHVRVTPMGIERTLSVRGATVQERIFAAHEEATTVVEWSADAPVRLEISFRSDLRLMWPYPGWCLGPLRWKRTASALVIHGSAGDDRANFSCAGPLQEWHVRDASGEANPIVESRLIVALEGADTTARLTVSAAVDGEDSPADSSAPTAIAGARAESVRRLLDERLAVTCSEPGIADALVWATYRLDSAIVSTPGLGTSLIAGYWRSSEGWGDGRPGYAWYFGRDAVWTALGSLAVGDFEAAALTLRFLARHQDFSGKILHECTTSGVVHYDAADSTTLYLLLVARYLAWTGDTALIREEWPYIGRAFDFALSTDRDGDGLVENTRVGHGWIEFGRLGGGDVTHYNAAIWTAALTELADAARVAGQPEFATRIVALAIRARHALERTFFDEEAQRYALCVRREPGGRWDGNWTQTAMQAVPLLLGMADPARMQAWLDAVAGDAFTAPWGLRMVPNTDPHYDPKSYHGGAVWPLYTGWVSWAEFTAGRSAAAIRHLRMNTVIAFEREKGAWDEVLHGDEHRAAGVCPDQAWSTAMAVAPFVHGLLGITPDALRKRLRIAPQIPEEWERLRVERIRIGDTRVAFDYSRESGVHRFRLSSTDPACRVLFEPAVPVPVADVSVNGLPVRVAAEPFGERYRVRLELTLAEPVTIEVHT